MEDRYDLAGLVRIQVTADQGDALRTTVRTQMDPCAQLAPGAESQQADVVLQRGRLQSRVRVFDVQGTGSDGMLTAWDGSDLHLVRSERWCRIPDLAASGPARFVLEPGFPVADAFRHTVQPALQVALLRHAAVAVHAACVEFVDRSVLIAGWSESGKTETALALAEVGAGFVSDKWTVLRPDGAAAPFPVSVGIRRWVVPYLPRLSASLTAGPRARLRAAAAVSSLSGALRAREWRSQAGQFAASAASRTSTLADRVALAPSAVRALYAPASGLSPAPLAAVVLLVTIPEDRVTVQEASLGWAVERLVESAAFERQPWFSLGRRRRYAAPDRFSDDGSMTVMATERELLQDRLRDVPLLRVTAPFPTDPRRVAAAVSAALTTSW